MMLLSWLAFVNRVHWVQTMQLSDQATSLGFESICRLLLCTATVAIYYCY